MSSSRTLHPTISHVDLTANSHAAAAVFVDRDGVVNEQQTGKYVHSWQDFVFLPEVLDAFVALKRADTPTYIVTNQGGVGRGFLSAASLDDIHDRMVQIIRSAGGRVDAIIHCPHAPTAGCPCRKPRPGMLFALADRFGIQPRDATFIGDNVTDLEAGRDAGCTTVLVATGEGRRSAERLGLPAFQASPGAAAEYVRSHAMPGLVGMAPTLSAAVNLVIAMRRSRPTTE